MKRQQKQAINRVGLDAAFEADEARKSNLILEAQLLREQSRADEAAHRFAEAARIEESLQDIEQVRRRRRIRTVVVGQIHRWCTRARHLPHGSIAGHPVDDERRRPHMCERGHRHGYRQKYDHVITKSSATLRSLNRRSV